MTTTAAKTAPRRTSAIAPMTKVIATALKQARSDAVKTAHMHHTPIVYLRDGKIISERPVNAKS